MTQPIIASSVPKRRRKETKYNCTTYKTQQNYLLAPFVELALKRDFNAGSGKGRRVTVAESGVRAFIGVRRVPVWVTKDGSVRT